MKLNYDCVRDVLLELEKTLLCKNLDGAFVFETMDLEQLHSNLSNKKYSIEDIFYTIHNLEQAGYIRFEPLKGDGQIVDCVVYDVTYEGHQFLQNIRPKKVWDKSKPVFKNLGTISIDIIKSVTSTVISDTINHYLPGCSSNTQMP